MESPTAPSATVLFEGATTRLYHGDTVGRHPSATLCIRSPWVPPFRWMISVRGHHLCGLPLGGRDTADRTATRLCPGMALPLSDGLDLQVVDVEHPTSVLCVEVDDHGPVEVHGVSSYHHRHGLRGGWRHDADWRIYADGSTWFVEMDGHVSPVTERSVWTSRGSTVKASVQRRGVSTTELNELSGGGLTVRARFDTVVFERPHGRQVVLGGLNARLLAEIVVADAPVPWGQVAEVVWAGQERSTLRRRWDVQLVRLRHWLDDHGLPHLVQMDGQGRAVCRLTAADVVLDES